MWYFFIRNLLTGERAYLTGYSKEDAYKRYPKYNPRWWEIVSKFYESIND